MKRLYGYDMYDRCPIDQCPIIITEFGLKSLAKKIEGDCCDIHQSPIKKGNLKRGQLYRLRFGDPYEIKAIYIGRTTRKNRIYKLLNYCGGINFWYYCFQTLNGDNIYVHGRTSFWEIHPAE